MTYPTALVLEALDQGHVYGFDIIDATRLRSGTVYPLLRRLEEFGLVRSKWEKVGEARKENRPPRKYYELRPAAAQVLAAARDRYPAIETMELVAK
jgi:DNA-binding PadR family transcriptional regulator